LQEIKVEVAEQCISMRMHSSELVSQIRRDYKDFLSSHPPSLTLDINLIDKGQVNDSSWAGLTVSGSELTLSDDHLQSTIDLASGKGTATLTSSKNGFNIGLGTLLRNMFTLLLLLRDESAVLHAAAVLRKEKVYVFMGPSGSGKTTVCGLSEDYTVLSDDMVVVKRLNGSYGVFPTPRWLDLQRGDRKNRGYKISRIFRLVQDNRTYIREIPRAQAMAEIFTLPHIPAESQPVQKLFNIFESILKEFGLYELHFKKDTSFWRHIDGLER
jgi:hypothetical protein